MNNENKHIDATFNLVASEIIKKYREKSGMSLSELARKVKLSKNMIFKYENNISRMKITPFINICNALNLNPEDVFNEISIKAINRANKNN